MSRKYKYKYGRKVKPKTFLGIFLLAILIALIVVIGYVRYEYTSGLKPVSNSNKTILVTIPKGSSMSQIAKLLKDNGLIKSEIVFQEYLNTKNLRSSLEAGTYALSPNQGVVAIVNILSSGHVASKLVTILPGQTLSEIRNTLINNGFSPNSVDKALDITNYSSLPVSTFIPPSKGLDGFIFPDSYQKENDTNPSIIISESLKEMGNAISPSFQNAYAQEGLSVYQAVTLASIIEREVSDYSDQQKVAQAFINRLKQNMPLESNVTAFYATSIGNQAYNTYNQPGLPPSPICNVDAQVLKALANPIDSNNLYFVTGADGKTRFADTKAQHDANIAQYGQAKE